MNLRNTFLLQLVLSTLLALPVGGRTEELFLGGRSIPLTSEASSLLLEDFDGDGQQDIAVTHGGSSQVSVLLNNTGSFSAPRSYDVGLQPISLVSGRLDGDGTPDLVVVNSGSSSISVLLNRGDGTFMETGEVTVGDQPRVAVLADFNGDGTLDAATSNLASFDITILLGNGLGGFAAADRLTVGDNPHSLVADDFDGDGAADLVVARRDDRFTTGSISHFRGLGDGTFAAAVETDLRDQDVVPRFVAAGDFDRDGRPDVAVLGGNNALLVLENNGADPFDVRLVAEVEAADADFFSGFLLARDFDGDGLLDIIVPVGLRGEKGVRIYHGDGNGAFSSPIDFFLGAGVAAVGFADVERDGLLDAIAAWDGEPALSVFHGTAPGRLGTRTTIPLDQPPRGLLVSGSGPSTTLAAFSAGELYLTRGATPGGFGPPVSIPFPDRAFQDAVTGDFDADGEEEWAFSDIAVGAIVLLSLNEDDTVAETIEYPVGSFPSRLACGDFNGDGVHDLAVTDQASPAVSILFGTRGAAPEPQLIEVPVGSVQTAIDTADVDGDGAVDVVVATRQGVRILFGDGTGNFFRTQTSEELANSPTLTVADLDGDGANDLVGIARRKLVILWSISTGARREEIDPAVEIRPIAVHDVDLDGRLDLITASPRDVLVLRGRKAGDFAEPETYSVGLAPAALLIADVDGDGHLDCATANSGSRTLSILHGAATEDTAPAPRLRRGDTDGNGRVAITDAIALLESLFLGDDPPGCPDAADANDDGRLDLTDAVSLLVYLFRGGAEPAAPGPRECGEDPTADPLDACETRCVVF